MQVGRNELLERRCVEKRKHPEVESGCFSVTGLHRYQVGGGRELPAWGALCRSCLQV